MNERREFGHWEIDTVHGSGRDSVVTIVERKTGLVLIGKLPNLSAVALNERVLQMIRGFERKHGPSFRTITADNGTEFQSYEHIERKGPAPVLLCDPLPLVGARHEREHEWS